MKYYNAIDNTDFILLNNLKVCKGFLASPSFMNASTGVEGAVSMYQVLNQHQDKEAVFETIRKAEFPNCPSRLGAIYCFVDIKDATYANAAWWKNGRMIVEAEPSDVISMGVFDSKQLNVSNGFEDAARKYFSGEHSAEPLLEAVITGRIYIPLWEKIVIDTPVADI
jgi:hypothetical protein